MNRWRDWSEYSQYSILRVPNLRILSTQIIAHMHNLENKFCYVKVYTITNSGALSLVFKTVGFVMVKNR